MPGGEGAKTLRAEAQQLWGGVEPEKRPKSASRRTCPIRFRGIILKTRKFVIAYHDTMRRNAHHKGIFDVDQTNNYPLDIDDRMLGNFSNGLFLCTGPDAGTA